MPIALTDPVSYVEVPTGEYVEYLAGGYKVKRRVLKGDEVKDTFTELPIIDFQHIRSDDPTLRAKLVQEVKKAAHEVGFFYAKNTPIPVTLMDEAMEMMTRFYSQDYETKMECFHHKSPAAKGFKAERLPPEKGGGIYREFYNLGRDYTDSEQSHLGTAPSGSLHLNVWPERTLPELRPKMYEYYFALLDFSKELIRIFALALGLPEDALDKYFDQAIAEMTTQHSNAIDTEMEFDKPFETLHAHADHAAVTILMQDRPSLQVLNGNAHWVPANPIEHCYVINTGYYLENFSNGYFPATVHRVVAKTGKERVSVPFFLMCNPDAIIQPVAIAPGDTAHYDAWKMGQRYIKGMFNTRLDHPMRKMWKDMGISDEDYNYDMVYVKELPTEAGPDVAEEALEGRKG